MSQPSSGTQDRFPNGCSRIRLTPEVADAVRAFADHEKVSQSDAIVAMMMALAKRKGWDTRDVVRLFRSLAPVSKNIHIAQNQRIERSTISHIQSGLTLLGIIHMKKVDNLNVKSARKLFVKCGCQFHELMQLLEGYAVICKRETLSFSHCANVWRMKEIKPIVSQEPWTPERVAAELKSFGL